MQETIAYGTMMMTLGLVLSGIGWRAGPAAAAAFGVVVLLTAHIVTPADLASGSQVLWRPFLAIVSIMLTANVARRLGMSLDGVLRQAWIYRGVRYDQEVWSLLADEWRPGAPAREPPRRG